MGLATITYIQFTPAQTEPLEVEIAWRYCATGPFTIVASNLEVPTNGILTNPVVIPFDENICEVIEVRITYENCDDTNPYYAIFPSDTGFTTTTTTSTTTTSTSTTTSTTIGPVQVYWGFKDTNITLTPSEIEASPFSANISNGATVVADYTSNPDPKYLWMAEPVGQPLKTEWWANAFNNGNIGTEFDLFDAPVISGGYRFYITEYLTQNTEDPIEFRV